MATASRPPPQFSVATPHQLAQVLRGFRKSQGLTQAQVAKLGGLLQKTVSLLETHPAQASVDSFYRVIAALNLDLALRQKANPKADW